MSHTSRHANLKEAERVQLFYRAINTRLKVHCYDKVVLSNCRHTAYNCTYFSGAAVLLQFTYVLTVMKSILYICPSSMHTACNSLYIIRMLFGTNS